MPPWPMYIALAFRSFAVFASVTTGYVPISAPPAPAWLHSAECARHLVDESLSRRESLGQVTNAEVLVVEAVAEEPRAVVTFLVDRFPALSPARSFTLHRHFAALWRRLPEVVPPPPLEVSSLEDERIVEAWRAYKSALVGVSRSTDVVDPRQPQSQVITFDRRAFHRLAASSDEDLAKIRAVPWDARAIVNYLRARYPGQSVRRSGWGDRSFNRLWRETFNVTRPWSLLGKVDTDQVIFKNAPGANDRVIREWRLFIIFLVFHQGAPDVDSDEVETPVDNPF